MSFKLSHHIPTQRAYITHKGKRFYLGRWPSDESRPPLEVQANYHRLVTRLLVEPSQEVVAPTRIPRVVVLRELCQRYLDWGKTAFATSRYHLVMEWSFRFILARYENLPVAEFGPLKLKQALDDAVNFKQLLKGKPKQLSRQSVNRILASVKALFRWGVENELVPVETKMALECVAPLRLGRTAAPESPGRKSVSKETVIRSLPLFCPMIRSMVEILMYTGMRPSELLSMRKADLTFTNDSLGVYRPKSHKTEHHGRIRQVALGPKAVHSLKPWYDLAEDQEFLFSPRKRVEKANKEKVEKRKTPRQPSQELERRRKMTPLRTPAERYSRTSFANAVVRPLKKFNKLHPKDKIEVWTPSLLRKIWAQRVRDEMGLEASRAALGHASSEVTANHYARSDLKLALEAAARMG